MEQWLAGYLYVLLELVVLIVVFAMVGYRWPYSLFLAMVGSGVIATFTYDEGKQYQFMAIFGMIVILVLFRLVQRIDRKQYRLWMTEQRIEQIKDTAKYEIDVEREVQRRLAQRADPRRD